jgi:hypothetical protein
VDSAAPLILKANEKQLGKKLENKIFAAAKMTYFLMFRDKINLSVVNMITYLIFHSRKRKMIMMVKAISPNRRRENKKWILSNVHNLNCNLSLSLSLALCLFLSLSSSFLYSYNSRYEEDEDEEYKEGFTQKN